MNQRVPLFRRVRLWLRRHEEKPGDKNVRHQIVDEHFQSNAELWKSVYQKHTLNRIIDQYPQRATLHIIAELNLPRGSHVLVIGSGARILAVVLAQRDYIVNAIDRLRAALDLIDHCAIEVGLQERIITSIGDVHALDFKDQSFDLVLALKVIPWLQSPRPALMEMLRVLKPGGYAIISVENRWRLNHILDPRFSPMLSAIFETVNYIGETLKLKKPAVRASFPLSHSIKEFETILDSIGLNKSGGLTLGFGPFTLMGKRILPNSMGKKLHHFFQSMADRNVPGIRSTGSRYLVLAQKPDPVPRPKFGRDEPFIENERHNN